MLAAHQVELACFLVLHVLALVAEISTAVLFFLTGDPHFCICIIVPLLLSGAFCAHAAWNATTPHLRCSCLPLSQWPWPAGLLLMIPFGLLQGVVVAVALDDFRLKQGAAATPQAAAAGGGPGQRAVSSKFHCKAVNGVMEGCLSSAVILYAFWTLGYPYATKERWPHEPYVLGVTGTISLMSAGLGLMELDFCVARAVSRNMQRSLCYQIAHWLLRTTEVIWRVTLLVFFAVVAREWQWWWVPLAADFAATTGLVSFCGGSEKTWFIKLLCSIPCSFAKIFAFVDSPYKQRAAERLTRVMLLRDAAEVVLLPLIASLEVQDFAGKLWKHWQFHKYMVVVGLASAATHGALLLFFSCGLYRGSTADIYSACEGGSLQEVEAAIRELTQSPIIQLDLNHEDIDGNTPLMLAASSGHAEMCRALLQKGARIDTRAMHKNWLMRYGLPCWRRLCPGRCVWSGRTEGWTPLHSATWRNHYAVVEVLLETAAAGTPHAFLDRLGETPLHVASRAGHWQIAALLVQFRPDWRDVPNIFHQQPRDLAPRGEDFDMVFLCEIDGVAPRPPTPGAAQAADWPQEQVPVSSFFVGGHFVVPGLCSYIACSCGGALGHIFLESGDPVVAAPAPEAPARQPMLPQDPEAPAPGAPPGPWGAADLVAIDRERGEAVLGWDAQAPQNVPEEAVLGRGAYGTVWLARFEGDSSAAKYAVKNIISGHSIARRESEVANRVLQVPHPNLVRMFSVWRHSSAAGQVYLMVMEYCPGLLQKRIDDARPARGQGGAYEPPARALRWLGEVFLGLEHVHRRMLTLLRDLKPANVVLSANDQAKLTDFGFGRFGVVVSPESFEFGMPTGSPGYIAPEVLRREFYDRSADLYSLGVLAWTLFSGGLTTTVTAVPPTGSPRHGGDFTAYFNDYRLLAQCIDDPGRHQARPLPEDVRSLVSKLTARNRLIRPQHEQIRHDPLFRPLDLPAFTDPLHVVEEWCRGASHGHGGARQ